MSMGKKILVKIYQSILEYLLLLPIYLLIGINIISDEQLLFWIIGLFGLFTIGIICRTIVSQQQWWFYSIIAIVIAISFSFIFADRLLLVIILTFIQLYPVYRGMMYASQGWEELLPTSLLWIGGLGVYFVSYFIFKHVDTLKPYLSHVTVFGVVFIVLIMFISNSGHLKSTTLSQEKKPFISQTIKSHNRIYLIITIAVILLIANVQKIHQALWSGFRTVIKWILEFLSGREGSKSTEELPPADPIEPTLPFEEPKESSAFTKLIEMITMYMVYIFVAIVVIAFILLFIKKTRIWIINKLRLLIQFLKGIVRQMTEHNESTQYVEEKESVFDWQEWKEEQQSKAKGFIRKVFKRQPRWDSLSNQQKVRWIFRQFIEQNVEHDKFKDHATPREMLEGLIEEARLEKQEIEQLRIVYEQTRYGEQDVDQQIVDEIYALLNKK